MTPNAASLQDKKEQRSAGCNRSSRNCSSIPPLGPPAAPISMLRAFGPLAPTPASALLDRLRISDGFDRGKSCDQNCDQLKPLIPLYSPLCPL